MGKNVARCIPSVKLWSSSPVIAVPRLSPSPPPSIPSESESESAWFCIWGATATYVCARVSSLASFAGSGAGPAASCPMSHADCGVNAPALGGGKLDAALGGVSSGDAPGFELCVHCELATDSISELTLSCLCACERG